VTHDTEPLWRELRDRLRAFIARRVENPADVEDLLQEAFLRIHQHLSAVRDTGRLLP
jgi:RNA polymerase sigma-70 factor (ECF subfamily)